MKTILIKNATVVNEGAAYVADVLITNQRIAKIEKQGINATADRVIDAAGKYLLPGVIDDQVHFREPGLTYKGTIFSESRAAIAGGITTYIEQPNTKPAATTLELLEEKFAIAARSSLANYSFNLGATNDNIEELLRADRHRIAGIKVFMGSSTGNMLVDDTSVLSRIFSECDQLIITHCEDEATIRTNLEKYSQKYGAAIPATAHPYIRSEEACYLSSSMAVQLAKKHGTRLHVYHISTAKETALFSNKLPLAEKRITAEVCIHHLWFAEEDYATKGNFIKWNPAVKKAADRDALWTALLDDRLDVIATDHAPHTIEEKRLPYIQAPSGGPLVQHALPAMLKSVAAGKISMERMVEKMCHNPAILFRINGRGFIREGYFADLVLVDMNQPQTVTKENLLYHCGWSPFEGTTFGASITHTFVNGEPVFENGTVRDSVRGQRLTFDR